MINPVQKDSFTERNAACFLQKLERFDPKVHGCEINLGSATGGEFSAMK